MNTVLRFAILQQNILETDIYFTKHFGTFRFFAMLYTPRLQFHPNEGMGNFPVSGEVETVR